MNPSDALIPFVPTLQKTEQWMHELMDALHTDDAHSANRAFRAALHALRDRLLPNEAVHLAAQMPPLLRGIFFEGWDPARTPTDARSLAAFLDQVARQLMPQVDPDPNFTTRAVFDVLSRHISPGELDDVRDMLPADLKRLFPVLPGRS